MKDFNLKNQRERLRKIMIMSLTETGKLDFGMSEAVFDKCFEQIEKQDKEFIGLLKEEIKYKCGPSYLLEQIDKLSGDALKDNGEVVK